MSHTNQITDDAYDPADELRELLAEVRSNARLHYEEEQPFQLPGGYEATQLSYTVTFDGFELTGTETITPFSVMVSLDGHLGCATSVILANSLIYGVPTQAYIDEGNTANIAPAKYRDLTAEWYADPAIETGIAEARLENRAVDLDANLVQLDRLEEWARVWLKAGD